MSENSFFIRCRVPLNIQIVWSSCNAKMGYNSMLHFEVLRCIERLRSPTTHFLLPNGTIHTSRDTTSVSIRSALESSCTTENEECGNVSKCRNNTKKINSKRKKKGYSNRIKRTKKAEDWLTTKFEGLSRLLEIDLLSSISDTLPSLDSTDVHASTSGISLDGAKCNVSSKSAKLDVIVEACFADNLNATLNKISTNLANQLYEYSSNNNNDIAWNIFHFPSKLTGLKSILTLPLHEIDTTEKRKMLHWNISSDWPIFRPSASIGFIDTQSYKERNGVFLAGDNWPLRDVHIGCSTPKMESLNSENVNISVVKGSYLYYHYLQGNERDKGWGCAYRSLQTIMSWFRENHFTSYPVPCHIDTQNTLVDIGDKEQSFIGSTKWIGSTEIGYCLHKWINVTSKFIFVTSGADLPSKARELIEHFDTHGTPCMIGGGQLAFILLGVAFDTGTGFVRFLILDPHYTGPDDLSIIQKKTVRMEGYKAIPCSWRGEDAFNRNSSYNICLPQRPKFV